MAFMSGARRGSCLRTAFLAGMAAAASGAISCGEDASVEPDANYTLSFSAQDLTTSVQAVTLVVRGGTDVATGVVQPLVSQIAVATWPDLTDVSVGSQVRLVPGSGQPNAEPGHAEVELDLGSLTDPGRWYAVFVKNLPSIGPRIYYRYGGPELFQLTNARGGVRVSPRHAPVIGALVACAKGDGTVSVGVRFSEPVTKGAGAVVALRYGDPTEPCSVLEDTPGRITFSCSGSTAAAPFALDVSGSIVGQVSGGAVVNGPLRPADVQTSTAPDGCAVHKNLAATPS